MKYFNNWVESDKLDEIINLFDPNFANKSNKTGLNKNEGDTSLDFDKTINKVNGSK
jgi:hypothetical protein